MFSRWAIIIAASSLASCSRDSIPTGTAQGTPATRYVVTDLGTIKGFEKSCAHGINSRGQVVGASYNGIWATGHAFLYSDGKMIDLGTLGGESSQAVGINDNGQVVGWSETTGAARHAFLYSEGRLKDLGTLGGSSWATAINSAGEVVGYFSLGDNERAFLFSNGKMRDLGTLGGARSNAHGINADGQIVGDSTIGREGVQSLPHAFLYTHGQMTDLGILAAAFEPNTRSSGGISNAYAINAGGQVVGMSTDREGHAHAFLYANGRMTDLGVLGQKHSEARAINTIGEVVGDGITSMGLGHPFCTETGE